MFFLRSGDGFGNVDACSQGNEPYGDACDDIEGCESGVAGFDEIAALTDERGKGGEASTEACGEDESCLWGEGCATVVE